MSEAAAAACRILACQVLASTAVFAVVAAVTAAMRQRAPALQLCLWSLVFVRLALPPDLSHPLSLGALGGRVLGQLSTVDVPRGLAAGAEDAALRTDPSDGPGGWGQGPAPSWPAVVLVLWAGGVVGLAMAYDRRLRQVRRLVREATPVTEETLRRAAGLWARRLRVRRAVRVVTSSADVSPLTLGWLRPVIFLPGGVLRNPRAAEVALAHEMAHVARWDWVWARLQHLLQILYFFHPVVWLAGGRLDGERERVCDATVLGTGWITPRDYAHGLLGVLGLRLRDAGAPALSHRTRRLAMRARAILGSSSQGPAVRRALVLSATVGFFLLPLSPGPGVAGSTSATAAGTDPVEPVMEGAAVAVDAEAELRFDSPLPGGRVSQGWGPSRDPWTSEPVHHRGLDLAAPAGTSVRAPADGTVTVATEAYREAAAGTVVIVDHGRGWSTFYSHLGELQVTPGCQVRRGDMLATVGSSGRSTGPHLHFEVRFEDEAVDPTPLVDGLAR